MDWAREIDGKRCLSTGAMCEILGVTRQAMNQWEQQGCPKAANGWWCPADVLRWKGMVGPGLRSEDKADAISWREQKTKAEADLKKLQAAAAAINLGVIKGKYVPADEITDTLSRFFVVLKKSLLSLGRKVSVEVAPFVDEPTALRVSKMVKDIVTEGLEQISIDGTYVPPRPKK